MFVYYPPLESRMSTNLCVSSLKVIDIRALCTSGMFVRSWLLESGSVDAHSQEVSLIGRENLCGLWTTVLKAPIVMSCVPLHSKLCQIFAKLLR